MEQNILVHNVEYQAVEQRIDSSNESEDEISIDKISCYIRKLKIEK